jgi:hypothetical protein
LGSIRAKGRLGFVLGLDLAGAGVGLGYGIG